MERLALCKLLDHGLHTPSANFTTGNGHSFGGKFLEIKPNALIRFTDKFEDPTMPGEIMVTIQFKEVSCGTELRIKQENIPAMIPLEM